MERGEGPARGADAHLLGLGGTVTPFLTGLHNPLAIALAPDGHSLLVGDWATGTVYAIERDPS